jgi:hypothetical protein
MTTSLPLLKARFSLAAPSPAHRPRADFQLSAAVKENTTIYNVPRVENTIDAVDLVRDL